MAHKQEVISIAEAGKREDLKLLGQAIKNYSSLVKEQELKNRI